MSKINEQIERLRELVRKCYSAVAGKKGTIPNVGERTVFNLPTAIESIPNSTTDLVATENNKEYLPTDYGVYGFGKVKTELPKVKVNSIRVTNECVYEDGYWPAELFDTSEITNMYNIFFAATSLKRLDVSQWNTKNVSRLDHTFQACRNLEILDVSKWEFDNLVNLSETFRGCEKIKTLDLTNWDASNVIHTNYTFASCTSLMTLIGGLTIEYVLDNNTSCLHGLKATNMSNMFYNCNNLDRASLRALINGLADLTGQTAQTLPLGATLMAKLTNEDIAVATAKNWTIV